MMAFEDSEQNQDNGGSDDPISKPDADRFKLFLTPRCNRGFDYRDPVKGRSRNTETAIHWRGISDEEVKKIQEKIVATCQAISPEEADITKLVDILREEINMATIAQKEPAALKIERISKLMIERVLNGLSALSTSRKISDPVLLAKWSLKELYKLGLTVDTVSDFSEATGENMREHGKESRAAFNRLFLTVFSEKVQKLLDSHGFGRSLKCRYYFGSGLGVYICDLTDETNPKFNIAESYESCDKIPKKD